jgi:hypothetical protein
MFGRAGEIGICEDLEDVRSVYEKAGPYDVAPDGRRFLIVKAQPSLGQGQQNELQAVVNGLEGTTPPRAVQQVTLIGDPDPI